MRDICYKKRIGTGSFSQAYQQKDGKVIIVSDDPVKKLMSKGVLPDHRMFPKVTMIAPETRRTDGIYEMEYYSIVRDMPEEEIRKQLSKRQWYLLSTLRTIYCANGSPEEIKKQLTRQMAKCFHREMHLLFTAIDAVHATGVRANCEFQCMNLAVRDGKIVFLDCFFPSGGKKVHQISN